MSGGTGAQIEGAGYPRSDKPPPPRPSALQSIHGPGDSGPLRGRRRRGRPGRDVAATAPLNPETRGRLHSVKRVPELVRIYQRCLDAGLDKKLFIIGDGGERKGLFVKTLFHLGFETLERRFFPSRLLRRLLAPPLQRVCRQRRPECLRKAKMFTTDSMVEQHLEVYEQVAMRAAGQ